MAIVPNMSVSILSYEDEESLSRHWKLRDVWTGRILDLDGVLMDTIRFEYSFNYVRIYLKIRNKDIHNTMIN